ncbi:MAG: DUF1080 domain-containing protein [Fuerstiella sp.]
MTAREFSMTTIFRRLLFRPLLSAIMVAMLTGGPGGCSPGSPDAASSGDGSSPAGTDTDARNPASATDAGKTTLAEPSAASGDREATGAATAETSETANTETATKLEFVAPALTEQELRDGWISLFDGQTLFGWDVPSGTNWQVENGAITADSGERSLLLTPFRYDDFELRCDFHLASGGNSGIFLRTAEDAANPAIDTYELNICDTHESHPTGSLVGRHVASDVPAVEGSWHTFHVRCEGPHITVQLDGTRIVDFTDESEHVRESGRIGLQMNQGRIAFRNVFLRPLHSVDLFNGTDLSGFREVPGSKSRFVVQDGVIFAQGGPGFLETEATWDDFILHVESNIRDEKAIADGRPANSGVFFRAMAGTEAAPSNGYEMQIQHDFKNGDRTQPLDFGSGAIYRRQPARYIVADNNEWVVQTLIAQGRRFATFVNGYQVLDWIDEREADANPRKGLRLDAGHLSLQGHDPTTDLDFRAIRIHDLK